jgi:hypothetical protein
MEVINDAGITWQLARTWPGGRDRERAIKNRHEAPRLCPICTPVPYPVTTGRSAVIATPRESALVLPPPIRLTPRERGLRMAEQFLNPRAGWAAGQLAASFEYVTGPYYQTPSHTAAQDEAHRVFAQTVISRIALLAAADGAHALGGYQ